MEDVVTRRERKRLANRDAARDAALRLFMDRGFDAVSVEQVAQAADVSPSTVYRNFPTKEDLVLGDIAERQADLLDVIDRQRGGGTVGDLLRNATLQWAPLADQRFLRSEAALIVATPALMARLHQMMAEWEGPISTRLAHRCGRPATDLELRQLTALYCATIRIVIREWAAGGTVDDLVEFGRTAVEALAYLPAAALPVD
jgi:AcrR family transcriptional regulator